MARRPHFFYPEVELANRAYLLHRSHRCNVFLWPREIPFPFCVTPTNHQSSSNSRGINQKKPIPTSISSNNQIYRIPKRFANLRTPVPNRFCRRCRPASRPRSPRNTTCLEKHLPRIKTDHCTQNFKINASFFIINYSQCVALAMQYPFSPTTDKRSSDTRNWGARSCRAIRTELGHNDR